MIPFSLPPPVYIDTTGTTAGTIVITFHDETTTGTDWTSSGNMPAFTLALPARPHKRYRLRGRKCAEAAVRHYKGWVQGPLIRRVQTNTGSGRGLHLGRRLHLRRPRRGNQGLCNFQRR